METAEKTPAQVAAIEEGLKAEGQPTHTSIAMDYFGVDERHRVLLPDNVSWIEHKTLNEGERREYLKKTNKEVKLQRATGDAVMKMSPGEERQALLEVALTNWHLMRGGQEVAFNKTELSMFLTVAPPKILDLVEADIRLKNSWLQGDMTLEDIEKEIANLEELREQKLKEEEGKGSSSAK